MRQKLTFGCGSKPQKSVLENSCQQIHNCGFTDQNDFLLAEFDHCSKLEPDSKSLGNPARNTSLPRDFPTRDCGNRWRLDRTGTRPNTPIRSGARHRQRSTPTVLARGHSRSFERGFSSLWKRIFRRCRRGDGRGF